MGADGVAAANRLRGYRDIRHGMCLFYVWTAYKAEGARADRNYATALDGWNGSPGKHHGDRNPPPGVTVWFGEKPSSSAGDVVISLGGGLVVATDYPRYGVVGICTIQERQDQIGRPYLGWTETILGAAIDYPRPAPASAGSTPATPTASHPASSEEYLDMFYAIVGGQPNAPWYLVSATPGAGKPFTAVILGANAIGGQALPVVKFEWQDSIDRLKAVTDGIY